MLPVILFHVDKNTGGLIQEYYMYTDKRTWVKILNLPLSHYVTLINSLLSVLLSVKWRGKNKKQKHWTNKKPLISKFCFFTLNKIFKAIPCPPFQQLSPTNFFNIVFKFICSSIQKYALHLRNPRLFCSCHYSCLGFPLHFFSTCPFHRYIRIIQVWEKQVKALLQNSSLLKNLL